MERRLDPLRSGRSSLLIVIVKNISRRAFGGCSVFCFCVSPIVALLLPHSFGGGSPTVVYDIIAPQCRTRSVPRPLERPQLGPWPLRLSTPHKVSAPREDGDKFKATSRRMFAPKAREFHLLIVQFTPKAVHPQGTQGRPCMTA
jgi:hypothetical protein